MPPRSASERLLLTVRLLLVLWGVRVVDAH